MPEQIIFETTPTAERPQDIIKTYVEAARQHAPGHYMRLAAKGMDQPGNQMFAAAFLEMTTRGKEGEYSFVNAYVDDAAQTMVGFSLAHRFEQAGEPAYVISYLSYLKKSGKRDMPADLGDKLLATTLAAIPPSAVKIMAIAPRDALGVYAHLSGVKVSNNPLDNDDRRGRLFTNEKFSVTDTAQTGDLCLLHLPRQRIAAPV